MFPEENLNPDCSIPDSLSPLLVHVCSDLCLVLIINTGDY